MARGLGTRNWLVSCGLLLCTAVAAPRANAVNLPFTGTLRFDFAVDRAAVPFVLNGTGVAVVNGSGPGGHLVSLALPGSTFAAAGVVLPVTDVIGAGTAFGSGIPLAGDARFCLYAACGSAVGNFEVPLSLVGGGTSTMTGGFANQTVIGAPWTTGTAAVGTLTRMGFAHGAASATSSTAAASGTIQLVTPIFLSTGVPTNPIFASFATLTLHFVPEPTTPMLAASALALLGLGARRARR
jgi:hypothetical protein